MNELEFKSIALRKLDYLLMIQKPYEIHCKWTYHNSTNRSRKTKMFDGIHSTLSIWRCCCFWWCDEVCMSWLKSKFMECVRSYYLDIGKSFDIPCMFSSASLICPYPIPSILSAIVFSSSFFYTDFSIQWIWYVF